MRHSVERQITEAWSQAMFELVLAPDEPELAPDERATLWTRKEAVLKCVGDGLTAPPSGLALSGRRVRAWTAHPNLASRLRVADTPSPAGYACSLAVIGEARSRFAPSPDQSMRNSSEPISAAPSGAI